MSDRALIALYGAGIPRAPHTERTIVDTVYFGLRRFLRYVEAVPRDTMLSRDTGRVALCGIPNQIRAHARTWFTVVWAIQRARG